VRLNHFCKPEAVSYHHLVKLEAHGLVHARDVALGPSRRGLGRVLELSGVLRSRNTHFPLKNSRVREALAVPVDPELGASFAHYGGGAMFYANKIAQIRVLK